MQLKIEQVKQHLHWSVRMKDIVEGIQKCGLSYSSVAKDDHLHGLPLFTIFNQLLNVATHFILFHACFPWNTVSMNHFWKRLCWWVYWTVLWNWLLIPAFNSWQMEFKFAKYVNSRLIPPYFVKVVFPPKRVSTTEIGTGAFWKWNWINLNRNNGMTNNNGNNINHTFDIR